MYVHIGYCLIYHVLVVANAGSTHLIRCMSRIADRQTDRQKMH